MNPVNVNFSRPELKEAFRNDVIELAQKYEELESQLDEKDANNNSTCGCECNCEHGDYQEIKPVVYCGDDTIDNNREDLLNIAVLKTTIDRGPRNIEENKKLTEIVRRVPVAEDAREETMIAYEAIRTAADCVIEEAATGMDATALGQMQDKFEKFIETGMCYTGAKVYHMGYMDGVIDALGNVERHGGAIPESMKNL